MNVEILKIQKDIYGKRLELNAHLVTILKDAEKNLRNCLSSNIEIHSFVLEPLASAYAVLNSQEQNLGTLVDWYHNFLNVF